MVSTVDINAAKKLATSNPSRPGRNDLLHHDSPNQLGILGEGLGVEPGLVDGEHDSIDGKQHRHDALPDVAPCTLGGCPLVLAHHHETEQNRCGHRPQSAQDQGQHISQWNLLRKERPAFRRNIHQPLKPVHFRPEEGQQQEAEDRQRPRPPGTDRSTATTSSRPIPHRGPPPGSAASRVISTDHPDSPAMVLATASAKVPMRNRLKTLPMMAMQVATPGPKRISKTSARLNTRTRL